MLVISTIVWEVVRTNPAYNFIVEPWALRGYETEIVLLWIGVSVQLLVLGYLVGFESSTEVTWSAGIVVGFGVLNILAVLILSPDPFTITMPAIVAFVVAVVVGLIVRRLASQLLGSRLAVVDRGWMGLIIILLAGGLTFALLSASAIGTEITIGAVPAVAVTWLILSLMVITKQPMGLAATRLLVILIAAGWAFVVLSAGGLRTELLDAQTEALGVSAQYKDVQASLGWFVANLGMLIAFAGAVGLWAKRRDQMLALIRARRQREAAEKSAAEIKAAGEAYQRQRAAAEAE